MNNIQYMEQVVRLFLSCLFYCILLPSYAQGNCPTANLPLVIGGMTSSTQITALAMEGSSLYVAGTTSDNDLRNYASISSATPIILKYGFSGSDYLLSWGKTYMAPGDYVVNGVAVSSNQLFVVAHAYSPTQNSLIFLVRTGGYNNFVYLYPNSKNGASLNRKNILLNLINNIGTYHFIFGSRYTDTNDLFLGFQIICYTFLDSFPNVFNSNNLWALQSKQQTSSDQLLDLTLGPNTEQFYSLGVQQGKCLITKIQISNGARYWTYQYQCPQTQVCLLTSKSLSSNQHMIFVGCGDSGTTKQFLTLSVDSSTGYPNSNGLQYQDGSTFNNNFQIKGVYISTQLKALALLYDPAAGQTYLATLDLEYNRITYNKEFPRFPVPQVSDQSSFAIFQSETVILIASFGTGFYQKNENSLPAFSFSQTVSFIYSSQTTNSCYSLEKDAPIQKDLTLTADYVTLALSLDPYNHFISSLSNPVSFTKVDIINAKMQQQSLLCKKLPFQISPGSSGITRFNITAGVQNTFNFVLQSVNTVCGTDTAGLNYVGNLADGSQLPSFVAIDSTGQIKVQPNSQLGFTNITITAFIPQTSQFVWLQYSLYANYPPVFKNSYIDANIKVKLNREVIYTLPQTFDYENDPITLQIVPHPIFISLSGLNLTVKPNASSQVGSYHLKVRLQDFQAIYSEYNLSLEVTNSLPRFVKDLPSDQKVNLNEVLFYQLPQPIDEEDNKITVQAVVLPSFAKLDWLQFTFSPRRRQDIGVHKVTILLTDNVIPGQMTQFSFKITVKNDSPYFKDQLVDQRLTVGYTQVYNLPQMEDKEKMNIFSKALFRGASQLPSFMNFTGTSFIFKPFSPSDVGVYPITILLEDGYCTPRFYNLKVVVEKGMHFPTKLQAERILAQIRITKANRDSTVEMKILIPKNSKIPLGYKLNLTNVQASQQFQGLQFSIQDKPNIIIKQSSSTWDNETQSLIIQLNISHPSEISNGVNFDNLVLTVQEDLILSSLNMSQKTKEIFLPKYLQISNYIPPQASQFMSTFAGSIKNGMDILQMAMIPGSIILNFFLALLIQYLWGLLNDLSFLTILTLVSISTPGLASVIQSQLLNFIYMDILMTDKWFVKMFYPDIDSDQQNNANRMRNLEDEDNLIQIESHQDTPLNSFFDQNGFSSMSLVKNLGSTFIFMLIYFLGYINLIVARQINKITRENTESQELQNQQSNNPKKSKNFCQKFEKWLQSQLMWNSTLRFILQQLNQLLRCKNDNCILINLQLKFNNSSDFISSSIAILIVILLHLVAYLIITIVYNNQEIIRYNQKDLEEAQNKKKHKVFVSKYGTITENLSSKTNIGIYWNSLVLMRWSITAIILVCLRNYIQLQIMTLLILNIIFQTLLVLGKPNIEALEKYISFFNEIMVSLYLYQLISLTDYSSVPIPSREAVGWCLVMTVISSVIVNLIKFFYLITKSLRYRWRKKKFEQYLALKKESEQAQRKRQQFREELKSQKPLQNSEDDRFPHIIELTQIQTINREFAIQNQKIEVKFKNRRIQILDAINNNLASHNEYQKFSLDDYQIQKLAIEQDYNSQHMPFKNYSGLTQQVPIKDAFEKSLQNKCTQEFQNESIYKNQGNNIEDLLSRIKIMDQNHPINNINENSSQNVIDAFKKALNNQSPESPPLQSYNSLIQQINHQSNIQKEEDKFKYSGPHFIQEYSPKKNQFIQ